MPVTRWQASRAAGMSLRASWDWSGSVAVAILAGRGHRVVASTGKADGEAYLRTLGAAEVVDRAQAEVYEVTERRAAEDYVALEELLQPTMDEIDSIASRGGISTGVPTGFSDLDEVTNGLHPGQMIIIAARPAMGKSALRCRSRSPRRPG